MIVVCAGPESSGTRLLTQIVDSCHGIEAWHESYPNDWRWPDLYGLKGKGVEKVVFINRDWHSTISSQVEHGHVPSYSWGLRQIREAKIRMWKQVEETGLEVYEVSYEMLIENPDAVFAQLEAFLGRYITWTGQLMEMNSKHYINGNMLRHIYFAAIMNRLEEEEE